MAITKLNSLAIPDDTIVEADLSYPLTGFSSTGIDDNATSTAITIDSIQRVGIGTVSPAVTSKVNIVGGNAGNLLVDNGGEQYTQILLQRNSTANTGGDILIDGNASEMKIRSLLAGDMVFGTGPTAGGPIDRMRLDSNGNVLVGTAVLTDVSSSGTGNEGAYIKSDGQVGLATSNDKSLIINRKTSDGDLAEFRKNGTTVGSIGVDASDNIYFAGGSGGTKGIYINNIAVYPADTGGSAVDNAVDLGSASVRWKDIYLSGGAYLGGTGSGNYLDDYEEGAHTCTVTMESGSCSLYSNYDKIKYTKIGDLVVIQGQIRVESVSSPSGEMRVSMPFSINTTADEGSNISGSVVRTYQGNAPTGGLFLHGTMVFNRGDKCVVQWSKSGSATVNHVPTAGEYLVFNFSYKVA